MSKILQYLAVAVCLIVVGMIARDGCGEKCPEVKTDTLYIGADTMAKSIYHGKPEPKSIIPWADTMAKSYGRHYKAMGKAPVNTHTMATAGIIDTMAILRDYFATRHYSDTLTDSSYHLVINETVTRNAIASREVLFQNLRPTSIIINTITPPDKFRIYAGAFYNSNAGVSASLEKNRFLYSLGIDTEKRPMFGISYRIR